MAEDDNSWVFDSLVCFLNGPIWDAPIQSFIEEKSLIFEASLEDNEEYKHIYDEYKNLVDFMLGNFMEDIGITSQQFQDACNRSKQPPVHFDRNLFEQIWAANDYEMFKRMMSQRNVELQLQALELIENKYGITPRSFIPTKKGEVTEEVQQIPVTIEKSLSIENEIMTEVAKQFPDEDQSTSKQVKFILEEKQILEQSLQETKEKVNLSSGAAESSKNFVIQTNTEVAIEPTEARLKSSENNTLWEVKPAIQIDQLELKKRQEYLRLQRDKLVALKKEARKKHFDSKTDTKTMLPARPKSAKAAEAVLTGERSAIGPQQLQLRRALAERLKSEVVDKELK